MATTRVSTGPSARAARPPGRYGVDAPAWVAVLLVLVAGNALQLVIAPTPWSASGLVVTVAAVGLGAHAGLRGKFVVWAELLDGGRGQVPARILDLGCGRGAVLVAAALRAPQAHAVGVDRWRSGDQSGNRASATMANAATAGGGDRVTLCTADVRALPMRDGWADLVVSSLAVHNLRSPRDRATALHEAARVLAPGGRVIVVDFAGAARRYPRWLVDAGLSDVERRRLGWRTWFSGPWAACVAVTASRPRSA